MHQSISTIGRSLGSGVATYLAVNRDIEKLALVTPYDSIANVAQQTYPVYPISWLLKDSYDSIGIANHIRSPTMILIAEHDRVIPPAHAHNLATSVSARLLKIITIEDAGHNSISGSKEYVRQLRAFFKSSI